LNKKTKSGPTAHCGQHTISGAGQQHITYHHSLAQKSHAIRAWRDETKTTNAEKTSQFNNITEMQHLLSCLP
jgi:hypothetical protein